MQAPIRFLTALILLHSTFTIAQIWHVEPLNWWVGMKNPSVQLLINGKAVGETTPTINYPGVSIQKTTPAESPNYLFIDLQIDPSTKPATFPIVFKKGNKTIYTHNYTLLPRQPNADKLKGFNSSDVIYLIVPDRFANGDPSNDIVPGMRETKIDRGFEGGRHGGDLRGMIDQLDYIANMGFTAIWTTPVLENDMDRYSYHGYSITNHYKVDPRFGSMNDYKEFAQKARQKGIKLIFDDVVNHIGLNYWWMNDLPFKNWINKVDTRANTNHRRTVHQDQYASAYDRDSMTRGWFVESMPDVNTENPHMANYITQCSIWWIETLQLGGIRQDTYPYSSKDFLKDWSCAIMNEYPDFNIVGEEWSINPLVTSYWQAGKQRGDGYTSCLKSVMDFPLQNSLMQAISETDQAWRLGDKLNALYEALANDFNYADPKNILVMADNHDMDRVYTQLNNDIELTKMALTYLLTIRGIPQLLYGTEILMNNTGSQNSHGVIRSDFPGGWKDDKTNGFTGTGLSPEQKMMQEYLQKLLVWRKTSDAIANGKTLHFAPFKGFYVYFRYTEKSIVMVIVNKNNRIATLDTNRFQEILAGKNKAKNVITGESIALTGSLAIAGKSVQVLEIQ